MLWSARTDTVIWLKRPPWDDIGREHIMSRYGIGWAVKQMRNGSRVARHGWNGKGMFLFLVSAGTMDHRLIPIDTHTPEWVAMKTAQGYAIPWVCSQADLLASDWEIVT